ncbi:MAG: AMP-binding protein, partial [Armatimonadetes bacterium]|nr:AMP-binding protein [Armatimonadota bacterium]
GFAQRFGVDMIEGYGPTEASPVVSVNGTDGTRKIGTIGPPLPEIEVTIRDDDFNVAPVDVPGELCVRGRNVMKGYWRDEERTAETIRDGWLLTGDVATVDADGYLRIVDRKKDMIIVGGMNVYSREVEDVLYRLGAVAEAAVVGIPNRLRGEDVKAYVALKEGAQLDATQVIEHCKSHLANYKVPRFVEFRPELPKSATGKILKRELREEARAAMADEPVS